MITNFSIRTYMLTYKDSITGMYTDLTMHTCTHICIYIHTHIYMHRNANVSIPNYIMCTQLNTIVLYIYSDEWLLHTATCIHLVKA